MHEFPLLRRDVGDDAHGVLARAGGVHIVGVELPLLALGEEIPVLGSLLGRGLQEREPALGHARRHHEDAAEALHYMPEIEQPFLLGIELEIGRAHV